MNNITVLGLGAMGSRMAARLLSAGKTVTVWNRSATAAAALVAAGARQAGTPREVVQEADVVISMLRDDDASRAVWLDVGHGALAGMRSASIAIESSTLSPQWITELDGHMRAQNIALLEAPVSGSRVHADAGQLVFLAAGEEPVFAACRDVLLLGAGAHHVGHVGDGALCKLATNALLGLQVLGLAEVIAMLDRKGADTGRILAAMASTPVWSPVATYLSGSMTAARFEPQFPVSLMEKDFSYTLREAGAEHLAPTIAAARQVFLAAKAQGLGDENMTSVIKLFQSRDH
ncbi:MAG: 2-hydroxy-3-oxopropionate reductase [Stenotrophomonas maltophilia]|uniref:2-hydroxy-3-oxopropionate reductase n=1 Tax=Stenotrophomonas maltophilia TaxID=40324 RepID=A0A7V8FDR1_STEMA|nr:MAG: 2-hydroxy-3-oxopropionate reductase [Stenotrophomonas maltophilia]